MAKQIYKAHNALLPEQLCNMIMKTVLRPDMEIIHFSRLIDFDGHAESGYTVCRHNQDKEIMTITSRTSVYTNIHINGQLVLSVDVRHPFIQKLMKTCEARSMEMGRIGQPKDGISLAQITALQYLKSIGSR